jgi:hypothetical protein
VLQGTLYGQKNKMLVGIIIPTPFAPQSRPPTAIDGPPEVDNGPDNKGNSQSPSKADSLTKRRLPNPHTGNTKVKRKVNHSTTEEADLIPPKVPCKSQTGKEITANILQQPPQGLVTTLFRPSDFGIGVRLELDDVDFLRMKTGAIAIILMQYDVEKLVKGAENQDTGREQAPLPLAG